MCLEHHCGLRDGHLPGGFGRSAQWAALAHGIGHFGAGLLDGNFLGELSRGL